MENIIDTAEHLELYKEYVSDEMQNENYDFLNFSEWRELNKEVLF